MCKNKMCNKLGQHKEVRLGDWGYRVMGLILGKLLSVRATILGFVHYYIRLCAPVCYCVAFRARGANGPNVRPLQ